MNRLPLRTWCAPVCALVLSGAPLIASSQLSRFTDEAKRSTASETPKVSSFLTTKAESKSLLNELSTAAQKTAASPRARTSTFLPATNPTPKGLWSFVRENLSKAGWTKRAITAPRTDRALTALDSVGVHPEQAVAPIASSRKNEFESAGFIRKAMQR